MIMGMCEKHGRIMLHDDLCKECREEVSLTERAAYVEAQGATPEVVALRAIIKALENPEKVLKDLGVGLCSQCVGDECPEKFSGAIMNKSDCFKNGWHVHKNGNGYAVFKDDDFVYKPSS